MGKIKKVIVKVNSNEETYYEFNGERFKNEREVLKKIFKDQGELYEKIYHVDRETARLAGWHPDEKEFSVWCAGWEQFLSEKGKINKEIIEEEFTIEEFTKSYVGF